MIKKILFLISLAILQMVSAQSEYIGIGTADPTKTLDINGELRIRNTLNASDNDAALYIDSLGVVKKLFASSPSRHIWGIIRFETNGSVSVINQGSGGWSVRYVNTGTAVINVSNPFASIPSVSVVQYFNANNQLTNQNSFRMQDTRDSSGVDAVTLNQIQVWVSDGNFARANQSKYCAFTITGF